MKSSIKIIDTGFYTSIQDNGRFGYRGIGVPVSGPMDYFSFNKANSLVENYNYEALLESTFRGPKILFSGNCKVAVTGAEVVIRKNDKLMKLNEPFLCELGDVLDIGVVKNGFRNYISLGSFPTDKRTNSIMYFLFKLKRQVVILDLVRAPFSKTDRKFGVNKISLLQAMIHEGPFA